MISCFLKEAGAKGFEHHLIEVVMSKFLIEVAHGADKIECLRSARILLGAGSHFLTNSEWGCCDDEHKAWFIAEVENKEEARMIVPPFCRKDTKITQLNRFKLKDVGQILSLRQTKQV